MHGLTRQAPPEARNSSKPKRLQHLQRRRRPAGLNDDDAEVQCEALLLVLLLLRRQPLLIVTAAVDVLGAGVVTITVYWYPRPLGGLMGPFGGPGCPARQPLGGCVGASKSAVTSTEKCPGGEKHAAWCCLCWTWQQGYLDAGLQDVATTLVVGIFLILNVDTL